MYLGIDIGTSSVKTVLFDADQRLLGQASAALGVSRPHPGWSEQDPEAWWAATLQTIDAVAAAHPLAGLRGIDADVTQDGDQAFRFIGSQWLSKAGDLGAYADPNGWTSVTGDVNGDGAVDFCIRVAGTPNLVASDFLL